MKRGEKNGRLRGREVRAEARFAEDGEHHTFWRLSGKQQSSWIPEGEMFTEKAWAIQEPPQSERRGHQASSISQELPQPLSVMGLPVLPELSEILPYIGFLFRNG